MRAKKRKITAVVAVVTLLIAILIFVFLHLRQFRDHRYYNVEQSLLNGEKIKMLFDENTRKVWLSFTIPHSSFKLIGGGDPRTDIYFEHQGIKYHFQTTAIPFLLNNWKNSFYVVTLGSIGPFNKEDRRQIFRFFKSKGMVWEEIGPEHFPRPIAIPNLDYIQFYPVISKPTPINPELKDFRIDFTARLWMRLEKGVRFYELDDPVEGSKEVDKEFLIDYKQKYIDPYWDEDKFKKNIPKCSKASDADLAVTRH